jgi:hypothetical protein
MKRVYRSGKATSLPPHLQVRQYGAESKMAPGKQLAVLGHGDGQVDSARRHRPRPDSWDAGGALRDPLNTLRRVLQRRQECVPSNLQNKQNSELIFHAQVVRGIYMYMQHAVFRHKATPLIVAPY